MGRDDFSKIPNGGPGLENRLQMIHEFGARAGRISLNRMVELLATNPAKLFELVAKPGSGQFVRRVRFGEELKAAMPVG
jgi:dihydropyrimidinase